MEKIDDLEAKTIVDCLLFAIEETTHWPALNANLKARGIEDPETALEQLRIWSQG